MKNKEQWFIVFVFTLLMLLTGCEMVVDNQAKRSLRCQSNYALELYDVNSSIEVYTKDDFITSVNQKNVYSAKWEDVDVDKMLQNLEKEKQSMEQAGLIFSYDISKIGLDLVSSLIIEFNSKNLDKLIDSDFASIINDSKVEKADYRNYLQSKGYVCVDA